MPITINSPKHDEYRLLRGLKKDVEDLQEEREPGAVTSYIRQIRIQSAAEATTTATIDTDPTLRYDDSSSAGWDYSSFSE